MNHKLKQSVGIAITTTIISLGFYGWHLLYRMGDMATNYHVNNDWDWSLGATVIMIPVPVTIVLGVVGIIYTLIEKVPITLETDSEGKN